MYARGEGRAPRRPAVNIGVEHCVGCLTCGSVCPSGALDHLPGAWAVQADPDRCTGCRRCERACPFGAIRVSGSVRSRDQVILDELTVALRSSCPAGWEVTTSAPTFRAGPELPSAAPDLAVVRTPRPAGIDWLADGADGLPPVPLVVEVVSQRRRTVDLGPRRDAYWRSGIPTYWTVDRRSGAVVVEWSTRPGWFDPWAAFSFG